MPSSGISKVLVALCAVAMVCTSCHSGATSKQGSSTSAKPSAGPTGAAPGALFEVAEPFSGNVSGSPVAQRSSAITQELGNLGGWGNNNTFQIDFSIPVFYADSHTPRMQVVGAEEYCFGGPDCDRVPARMPVPANAYIEGSSDLTCDPSGNTEGQGDCHLLVVERDEHKLYEIYQGTKKGDSIAAVGFFVWDLKKQYPATLRGDQCTSADAAGFPIAAMLPTADEVAAGAVNHPLRFILPNSHMKEGVYVRPATHAGGPQSTDPNAPPYGVRFRLKADFDESKFSASEKVIIKALKTYGMLLADGGEIPLTFADDRTSTAKWSNLGISAGSFSNIGVDQFEVVDLGPDINLTYDCVRNP
ncbi:hypothetical protein [Mycobacterium kubicae]|uniref:hypothetical protein n=1 Tax=Mycobacterium kubicae TaxID=120959 RepID=UPI000801AC04|nr:hypothetical protein [Mycobacterium kubicae]OBK54810.1 hypothetical protein A5657_12305 [Mycobacterium kubicae]